MAKRTAVVYDDRCVLHDPTPGVPGIPLPPWATVEAFERPERLTLTRRVLEGSGVLAHVDELPARFVSMGSSLEEASMDLGATPLATFRQVTLPRLAPAILAGATLAFTFSFDDVVISNFTAGAGNDTWPLRILSGLRFGLRPDLNAAATMMLAVTLLGLGGAALILRRAARSQGEAVGLASSAAHG